MSGTAVLNICLFYIIFRSMELLAAHVTSTSSLK